MALAISGWKLSTHEPDKIVISRRSTLAYDGRYVARPSRASLPEAAPEPSSGLAGSAKRSSTERTDRARLASLDSNQSRADGRGATSCQPAAHVLALLVAKMCGWKERQSKLPGALQWSLCCSRVGLIQVSVAALAA